MSISLPVVGAGLVVAYFVTISCYRLLFSPLAKFPGPKLAALTLWYEFWYDVVKRGQYLFKIKEMHDRYGQIVRISPYELHVNDPNFLPVLYAGGSKRRDKYAWALRLFGSSGAAIATASHDVHRMRRGAMNRYFSKESVRRLEPILQRNFEKLLQKLAEYKGSTKPLNVNLPFSAFTSDIITEYCFGKSHNWLDRPGFNEKFIEMMASVHDMAALAKQVWFIMPLIDMLPDSFAESMDPGMQSFIQFRREMRNEIDEIKRNRAKGEKKTSTNATVFNSILDSDLPEHEKETERLWQEAQVICIAGTETTAWALSVITFHLLSSPEVLRTLRDDLENAIPEPSERVEINILEKLPYLTAIIQEGLRLAFGVSTRLQRVCPDETLTFDDGKTQWHIPPGTPVGMSCALVHLNPDIFPDPLAFNPDRWIREPQLSRYLCSFAKGSRQCLGINLAYAQLYLCVAGIFRRYGGPGNLGPSGYFELFETTHEDVEIQYDLFVPFPKKGSKGVRVLVK
ncbi:hypothetical protein PV11_08581 [Exophiala sideris]|uniref:Cytochrome P450 n=1 Tax=Exophiala sideris TaxID=1016849 RepID=A0A0D1YDT0_9EURO|nr:hypothetical protein PV11_08581 [Exophiala sideris]